MLLNPEFWILYSHFRFFIIFMRSILPEGVGQPLGNPPPHFQKVIHNSSQPAPPLPTQNSSSFISPSATCTQGSPSTAYLIPENIGKPTSEKYVFHFLPPGTAEIK